MTKSKCCNADILRWFGNVTGVMFGQRELGKGTLICMKCKKPVKKG